MYNLESALRICGSSISAVQPTMDCVVLQYLLLKNFHESLQLKPSLFKGFLHTHIYIYTIWRERE